MTLRWMRSTRRADERLNRLRQELDKWPLEVGLFDLTDRFSEYAEAEVNAAWREMHGSDTLDTILQRQARAQARESALSASPASARWEEAASRCAASIALATSFLWAAVSLVLLAGLWGLGHRDLDVYGWSRLALMAALAIVNLRVAIPLAAFAVRLPMLIAGSTTEMLRRRLIRVQLNRCGRERDAAERRRSERDEWCGTELRAVMAIYDHKKELALRAAAAA